MREHMGYRDAKHLFFLDLLKLLHWKARSLSALTVTISPVITIMSMINPDLAWIDPDLSPSTLSPPL